MAQYPMLYRAGLDRESIESYSQLVSAPGPYLEFGEFIYLEATSTDASATLRLSGKFLSPDNEIRSFTEDMTITGTGTQTAVTSRIGPCWLMGFSVRVVAGTITDGEIVASVHIARASATNPVHVMTLASGEVTNTRALGLGAFTIRGPEATLTTTPSVATATDTPAAGAQAAWTVTAGQYWQLLGFTGQLVASGVAGNRRPGLYVTDGTNFLGAVYTEQNHTAGVTRIYSAFTNAEHFQALAGTNLAIILPNVLLGPGYVIGTTSPVFDAGDQWSALRLFYRIYS